MTTARDVIAEALYAVPKAEVARKIDAMSSEDVRRWLNDRLNNCHRIAAGKTGKDQDGWLEDAAYFAAAIGLIDWTEAGKP